jgi:hypothetical protein
MNGRKRFQSILPFSPVDSTGGNLRRGGEAVFNASGQALSASHQATGPHRGHPINSVPLSLFGLGLGLFTHLPPAGRPPNLPSFTTWVEPKGGK